MSGYWMIQEVRIPETTYYFLQRVLPAFAGSYPNHFFDRNHKDLAVAKLPGLGGLHDRVDRMINELVRQNDFDLQFGQELKFVFAAAIGLGGALLTTENLDLSYGQADYSNLLKRIFDGIQQVWSYNAFNLSHTASRSRVGFTVPPSASHSARSIAGISFSV